MTMMYVVFTEVVSFSTMQMIIVIAHQIAMK